MPNTTVENNFQLGASSDLYKTYQNKLAASPYTFKSLFMIHKENYFNYCNTYRTTWLIHRLPRPLLLVHRISAWESPTRRFTNTNNDLKHIWDLKLLSRAAMFSAPEWATPLHLGSRLRTSETSLTLDLYLQNTYIFLFCKSIDVTWQSPYDQGEPVPDLCSRARRDGRKRRQRDSSDRQHWWPLLC